MVTSAAIIGGHLADNPALASLPLAVQFVAVMGTTIPASLLMRAIGRRSGFLLASVIGILGAGCAALGIYLDSFLIFCLGTVGTGIYTGFGHYFRFAAIEVAPPNKKNTAISYVLAGGIVAAVIGPNLANLSREAFAITYLGTLLSVIVLYGLNSINFLLIKLPRPTLPANPVAPRSMLKIARQPGFIAAVASSTVGYSVMVLLMTATPLEMMHQQHGFGEVAFVIQWHVLGMFAPSFVTGNLIHRFGVLKIMFIGGVLGLACVAINLLGSSVSHYWAALTLLGISWNFLFIGGTTLLTETYEPEERSKTQAMNDFLIFTTVTISSLTAGTLQHHFGWQVINVGVIPILIFVLLSILWLGNKLARADKYLENQFQKVPQE